MSFFATAGTLNNGFLWLLLSLLSCPFCISFGICEFEFFLFDFFLGGKDALDDAALEDAALDDEAIADSAGNCAHNFSLILMSILHISKTYWLHLPSVYRIH